MKHPLRQKTFLSLLPLAICFFSCPPAIGETPDYPVYVASQPNVNDFTVFANGGWDGNWFVGYDTCWIKKLPPVPPGNYARAYLGVKLGRAKLQKPINPRNILPVPGNIFMGISSVPAWTKNETYLVATTRDIPYESDFELPLEGVGESEWYWAEIPIKKVNFSGTNFLALWSNTPDLINVSSSPIVAAALGANDSDTWLLRDNHGEPPQKVKDPPGVAITYFQPAIALKLILAGAPHPILVRPMAWNQGNPKHLKPVVTADVQGNSVERVWLEYYLPKRRAWIRTGRPLWKAPYTITVEQSELPQGNVQLRIAAANVWEETGASAPFTVQVSTVSVKP